MKLKVGIAGLGTYFGGMWAEVFSKFAKTELAAVCDLRPGRAEEVAGWFGAKQALTRFDDLLAGDVDIVGVFTPGPLHAAQAIAALEAGRHVLSAVPTAWTLDECQDLIDAVERTGRKYMLAETPTYDPWVTAVRRRIESGEMGNVFLVESSTFQDLRGPVIGTDYFSQEGAPDGLHAGKKHAWRYGMPPFYYMEHSSGPITTALGRRMTDVTAYGSEADDADLAAKYGVAWSEPHGNPFICETGLFRMDGGAVAKITIGFVVAAGEGAPSGPRCWGTNASYLVGKEHDLLLTRTETQRLDKPTQPRPLDPSLQEYADWENSPYVVQDFVGCILDDTPPPIDVRKAVAFTAAGLCGHRSAMEGRTVAIPDFGK